MRQYRTRLQPNGGPRVHALLMYRKIKKPFHPSGETGSRKLVGFSKLLPHSEEVSQMNLDSKEDLFKGRRSRKVIFGDAEWAGELKCDIQGMAVARGPVAGL